MDDLHRIDDSELARSALVAFVEHKPDWLHLLLLSRRRPPCRSTGCGRPGQLADISFDVLKFSEQEDLEMLTGLCPDSAPQDLTSAAEWSGGWAAALQLAALAVRSRRPAHLRRGRSAPRRAGGSDRLVDSYLWHEVLQAERPELVDLLRVHRRGRPHELRTGRGAQRTIRCRATCCWRPRSGGCSSPASTPAGGSRCTASCARCCWPSSSVARPSDCASSTRAQPGGWRAWPTTWRRSSTGWTPASRARRSACWRRSR